MIRALLVTGLLAVTLVHATPAARASGETPHPVVILHPGVATTPGSTELRAIFSMRLRRWPDGSPVRVFTLPDSHPTHRKFAEGSLRILPHLLRRSWDRLVFSGTGEAPIEVRDEAEMLRLVASTPGAIGYLSEQPPTEEVRSIPLGPAVNAGGNVQ
ncbi:hypothetical protein [Pseudomarimonas salicorniae]|uniref:PBP superfamily domain-containing protein n=1 Tax=Pseudomarimonas salicorniae TaxID=2933270 RepID=A0ABT0GF45_9GAMM|nr:hypothetical protein [Lysobacter sp. CAU 1642]MCK7593161.1 hypothetical protein [Lysobacter sp. CAU 1642]